MENNAPLQTATSTVHDVKPGRGFWLMMFASLAIVGGLAYLQFQRTQRAGQGRSITALPPPLPVISKLPDVAFTERSGKPFRLSDMRGRIWIADFIFTSCAGQCPVISNRMKELQTALKDEGLDDVTLVSFSVDPERDTPEALTEYADAHKADPKRWLFLTGDRDETYTLIKKGFLQAVEPETDSDQIGHSFKFFLVDGQGRVRAYYDVMTDEEQEKMAAEILHDPIPPGVKELIIRDIRRLRAEGVR